MSPELAAHIDEALALLTTVRLVSPDHECHPNDVQECIDRIDSAVDNLVRAHTLLTALRESCASPEVWEVL